MSNIVINGHNNDVTMVSNSFLDNYMTGANGEFVKVYLCLLRYMNNIQGISVSMIADKLEHTEKDVIRALNYWDGMGIIAIKKNGDGEIIYIDIKNIDLDNESQIDPEEQKREEDSLEVKEEVQTNNSEKRERKEFTKEELKNLMGDEEVQMLLYITQTYLGKTLNNSDINTILFMYSELNFSGELIEYLIEYCVSNGHKAFRYIEKVALNWAEENISSVAKAKEYTASFNGKYYPVLKTFGITGRNPAEIEKQFIEKWEKDYGFDMEIIVEACNRTIVAIQKPSFQYADSILQKWLKKGVKSISDLKAVDSEHEKNKEQKKSQNQAVNIPKTNFNNFQQRSYDYDEMERMLLNRK